MGMSGVAEARDRWHNHRGGITTAGTATTGMTDGIGTPYATGATIAAGTVVTIIVGADAVIAGPNDTGASGFASASAYQRPFTLHCVKPTLSNRGGAA